jgi:sodium-type flagellar protein MotY
VTKFALVLLSLMASSMLTISISAERRDYVAPLDTASWTLNSSPLACSLEQDIPLYGKAAFKSVANRRANMNFDLEVRHFKPVDITPAKLISMPPQWKPNAQPQQLADVMLFPGEKPLTVKDRAAWDLLVQLEQGMFPTLMFDALVNDRQQVQVAVSSVNFQEVYGQFLNCVASLLPYSFEDIAETSVYFEFDRSDFTKQTREALAKIGTWLEYDKNLELVLVAGHTDSKGKRRYNMRLSKQRAQAVKAFFVEAGLPENKIRVQNFADTQPYTSNATPEGRSFNRRVTIKMVK